MVPLFDPFSCNIHVERGFPPTYIDDSSHKTGGHYYERAQEKGRKVFGDVNKFVSLYFMILAS